MPTTRFAPSPTGLLHLGHAFAALFAYDQAHRALAGASPSSAPGRFLVRIEDIDSTRARPEFETAIFEDLAWLGLEWERPVRRQSEHFPEYSAALAQLQARRLIYPCFCTRREIQEEITRAGHAPHGPDGPLYPGVCRGLAESQRAERIAAGQPYALRLDVAAAVAQLGKTLIWEDAGRGRFEAVPQIFGDVVLARKDTPASYHLAVVVDDAVQEVSLVTRGEDLLEATHLHRLLQELLGLPVPLWHHHRLVLDDQGRRLAKRDQARSLRTLREQGWTPEGARKAACGNARNLPI